MDPLDDYAYNHLSDHLTDLEDLRREIRQRVKSLIEQGRAQYAEALYADKLNKMDFEIASVWQALRLINEAFGKWGAAGGATLGGRAIAGSPDRFKEL